ncbi:uncharacterized protein Z518_07225 [Rhinocladiella mackenziei CBS 650.93]|uniref:laccase n=1 Tax=Rhinocladiella mackenziei CBS 650.93 TaxID=1442369 RepID=A0A0D2FNM7_9EURO|nr:uncharacterized protein Z518_07225 [Rhinocladiella mackenziei CBS 650.93]KIX03672.1 hypothetical protein Z518_07225 [Rhinocladiella mackenziei CBS 650.93]
MKFTKSPGLLALGLARNAVADSWPASASSASTTVTGYLTWATLTSTVATTTTSTVIVDANGKHVLPPAPNPAASSAPADDKLVELASGTAIGTWTAATTAAVDPAMHSDGHWIDWANDVRTIGTDGDVFTWAGDAPSAPPLVSTPPNNSAPKNSLPEPGSPSSNVTTPQEGNGGGSCNTAADRSKWCGGLSTSTDHYNTNYSTGRTCSYDFTITNTTIDFDGSGARIAFAINGQVPGPPIECNWGDVLQVTVHNELQDNATTIHWHGIMQKDSNDQDGVPGITECGIAPGSSRTYTMKLRQYGTGWYHSHVSTQYGDGVRGPMIIHGPATANYDIDMGTVMIDDTFNVTVAQQYERVAHTGPTGTVNYLLNGKNTKPDLSAGQHALWSVQQGKKHLFRLINSASQNMYSVHFDNHVMTVIAADYVPIVPYTTEWLNIGIGQRYDVVVEMNQPVAGYFLRAVTQTGCLSSCANNGLGDANGIILYKGAEATLPTSTYGNKTPADFAICLDEPIASLVPFLQKSAGTIDQFAATASTLPAGNVAQVSTSDDGTVFRWFINNGAINVNYTQPTLKVLAEGGGSNSPLISNPVTLNVANKWVYFVIQNQFFAAHPMHLHGHDMSLLGQGTVAWDPSLISTLNFENPPRRDTAMLVGSLGPGNPAGYTVIGFETDNPGAWLMHCHVVWHSDGGLALQWIERPDEIPAYADKQTFQDECSALSTYEAVDPSHRTHSSGSSGLKRRTYVDPFLEARSDNVVRLSESVEK